ncbi:hypothetical protein WJR50_16115 [Catalinimonas sp. 4WD22]|uniref:hypothetical protein n=1 Tax=Catalinimonas locisalis TaxID=3133978 RepID=UPI0031015F05
MLTYYHASDPSFGGVCYLCLIVLIHQEDAMYSLNPSFGGWSMLSVTEEEK